jgi:hypothetical protein
MAYNDVVNAISNAITDAKTLENVINGAPNQQFRSRLGQYIWTLATIGYKIEIVNQQANAATASINQNKLSVDNATSAALGSIQAASNSVQGAFNAKLNDLDAAINQAGAAAAGENGFTDIGVLSQSGLTQRQINNGLNGINELLALENMTDGMVIFVKSYHTGKNKGGGTFIYDSSKANINDKGMIINGWVRQVTPTYLNAYNFGALGDGTQNDYDNIAFDAISQYVKNTPYKGYAIDIEHGEYCVISQEFIAGQGYKTTSALDIKFEGMTDKSIIVKSDNAKLKLRDGLHYGYFDPNTGSAVANGDGYASNYQAHVGWIFSFCNIKKLVISGNVELDGNSSKAIIGGKYSNGGFDTWAYGLWVVRVENIYIDNVDTHDHLTDGILVSGCNYDGFYRGVNDPVSDRSKVDILNPNWHGVINHVTSIRNGRQCLSVTGGQNLTFNDCYFDRAGTDDLPLASMPKTTLDIETDVCSIRNLTFNKCFFGDAAYPVACGASVYGWDIREVTFNDCKFINNVSYMTVAIGVPEVTFNKCLLVGSLAYCTYYSQVESERTKFIECTISNNPKYTAIPKTYYMYVVNDKFNPIFRKCVWDVYASAPMISGDKTIEPRPLLDDCIFNIFNTDDAFSEFNIYATGTMRIRDLRTNKTEKYMGGENFKGKIYIEGVGNNIKIWNGAGNPDVIGINTPFMGIDVSPKASTVAQTTETTDTASKLNALIASLKNAGIVAN